MLTFRPLSPADLEQIHHIEGSIYSHPWTLGNFKDSLHAGYSCWVVEHQASLAGYAVVMIAAGEAHLLNLSIAAHWQGCGFGRRFLQHLLDVALQHGATIMFLEVRQSNSRAQALYRRMGFQDYGVRKKYYPAFDGREDAVVMGLPLEPPPQD